MTLFHTKRCKDCKIELPVTAFQSHQRYGRDVRCKACSKLRYDKRDPRRIFAYLFATQIAQSTIRGYPAPTYSLDDLITWVDVHPRTWEIWQAYVASDYAAQLRPSLELLDRSKPYSLDNLDLSVSAARRPASQRPVAAYLSDDTLHKGYFSLRDAARAINGRMWGITSVADGLYVKDGHGGVSVPKTYKGFIWRWL